MARKLSKAQECTMRELEAHGDFTYSPALSPDVERTVKALVKRGLVTCNAEFGAPGYWRVSLIEKPATPDGLLIDDAPDAPGPEVAALEVRTGDEPTREELIAALQKAGALIDSLKSCMSADMALTLQDMKAFVEIKNVVARCQ